MTEFDREAGRAAYQDRAAAEQTAPGRSPRTARLPASSHAIARAVADELRGPAPVAQVQAKGDLDGPAVHTAAAHGLTGSAATLPFLSQIQRAFGHHDVSGIRAHVGGPAAAASAAMNARAYASGDSVAFAQSPDLHTAAHEAAHVVQQRGGVRLAGGVGRAGDEYERHADAVADAVVRGDSAESLLDQHAHRGAAGGPAVQRDGEGETERQQGHGERRTPPVNVAAAREIPLFEHDFRTRWGNLHLEGKSVNGITTEARPEPGAEGEEGGAEEAHEGVDAARTDHGTEVNVHSSGRLRDLLMRDCRAFSDRFDLDLRGGGGRFRAGAQSAAINVFDLGQLQFQFNLIDVRAGNHGAPGQGPLQVHFGTLEASFQHQCSGTEFVNVIVQIAARFDPNWATIAREIGRRLGRQVVEQGAEAAAEAGTTAAETTAAETAAAETTAAETAAAETAAAETAAAETAAAETVAAETATTGLAEAGAAGLEGAELATAGVGSAGAGTVAAAVAVPVLAAVVIVGGTMWAMHNAAEEGRRIGLATWYVNEYAVQFADRIFGSHGDHASESQTGRGTAAARRAGEGRSDARDALNRMSPEQREAMRRQYRNRRALERHLRQELARQLHLPAVFG